MTNKAPQAAPLIQIAHVTIVPMSLLFLRQIIARVVFLDGAFDDSHGSKARGGEKEALE